MLVHYGQVLTAQKQAGRFGFIQASLLPSHSSFQSIGWTNYRNIGDQAQAHSSFDGLMGRSILAQSNGIMGQYENGLNAHQCSHTNGRTQEVGKYQEGAAKGNKATVQSQAV